MKVAITGADCFSLSKSPSSSRKQQGPFTASREGCCRYSLLHASMSAGPMKYGRRRTVQDRDVFTTHASDNAGSGKAADDVPLLDIRGAGPSWYDSVAHEMSSLHFEEENEDRELSFYDGDGRRHVFKGK